MPDIPADIHILGQLPEEKAFEDAVRRLLTEDMQKDPAFVKLLQVWFEEGWDARDNWWGDDT